MGRETATKKSIKTGPKRRGSVKIGPKRSISQSKRLEEEAKKKEEAEKAAVHAKAEAKVNVMRNVAKAARKFKKRRRTSGMKEDKTLYVKYHIFNILDIDTLDSTFTVRFSVEATWEEPQLNGFEKHEVTLEILNTRILL